MEPVKEKVTFQEDRANAAGLEATKSTRSTRSTRPTGGQRPMVDDEDIDALLEAYDEDAVSSSVAKGPSALASGSADFIADILPGYVDGVMG